MALTITKKGFPIVHLSITGSYVKLSFWTLSTGICLMISTANWIWKLDNYSNTRLGFQEEFHTVVHWEYLHLEYDFSVMNHTTFSCTNILYTTQSRVQKDCHDEMNFRCRYFQWKQYFEGGGLYLYFRSDFLKHIAIFPLVWWGKLIWKMKDFKYLDLNLWIDFYYYLRKPEV